MDYNGIGDLKRIFFVNLPVKDTILLNVCFWNCNRNKVGGPLPIKNLLLNNKIAQVDILILSEAANIDPAFLLNEENLEYDYQEITLDESKFRVIVKSEIIIERILWPIDKFEVILVGMAGNPHLAIFPVHLPPPIGAADLASDDLMEQLKYLKDFSFQSRFSDLPKMLIGDFNAEPFKNPFHLSDSNSIRRNYFLSSNDFEHVKSSDVKYRLLYNFSWKQYGQQNQPMGTCQFGQNTTLRFRVIDQALGCAQYLRKYPLAQFKVITKLFPPDSFQQSNPIISLVNQQKSGKFAMPSKNNNPYSDHLPIIICQPQVPIPKQLMI